MLSRSIRVIANDSISFFLWWKNIPLFVYTTFSLPSCLSVDTYVVSSVLAVVNNAAANMGEHLSLQVSVSFPSVVFPEVWLLDHMVVLLLSFWGVVIVFSIVAAPSYIFSSRAQGIPLPYVFAHTCYFLSFW